MVLYLYQSWKKLPYGVERTGSGIPRDLRQKGIPHEQITQDRWSRTRQLRRAWRIAANHSFRQPHTYSLANLPGPGKNQFLFPGPIWNFERSAMVARKRREEDRMQKLTRHREPPGCRGAWCGRRCTGYVEVGREHQEYGSVDQNLCRWCGE